MTLNVAGSKMAAKIDFARTSKKQNKKNNGTWPESIQNETKTKDII